MKSPRAGDFVFWKAQLYVAYRIGEVFPKKRRLYLVVPAMTVIGPEGEPARLYCDYSDVSLAWRPV